MAPAQPGRRPLRVDVDVEARPRAAQRSAAPPDGLAADLPGGDRDRAAHAGAGDGRVPVQQPPRRSTGAAAEPRPQPRPAPAQRHRPHRHGRRAARPRCRSGAGGGAGARLLPHSPAVRVHGDAQRAGSLAFDRRAAHQPRGRQLLPRPRDAGGDAGAGPRAVARKPVRHPGAQRAARATISGCRPARSSNWARRWSSSV